MNERLNRILRGRRLMPIWAPNMTPYDQVLQFGFAELLEKALRIQFGELPTEIVSELHDMEPFTLHLMFEMLDYGGSLLQIMDDARFVEQEIAPVKRKRFPLDFPHATRRIDAEVQVIAQYRRRSG